jgi:hypothetical protein
MKTRAVAVILALVCAAGAAPRDLAAEGGVKIGASLAKFTWTEEPEPGVTLGFLPFVAGGLYYQAGRGAVRAQPELLVTRKGGRYANEAGDRLDFQFTYIEVPVLARFNLLAGGNVRPFVVAGGYGAYLYRAEAVLVLDAERTVNDIMDEYGRYDFGLVGGAGLAIRSSGVTLTVEGRYDLGLANIIKAPLEGEAMKTRSLMAILGFGF